VLADTIVPLRGRRGPLDLAALFVPFPSAQSLPGLRSNVATRFGVANTNRAFCSNPGTTVRIMSSETVSEAASTLLTAERRRPRPSVLRTPLPCPIGWLGWEALLADCCARNAGGL